MWSPCCNLGFDRENGSVGKLKADGGGYQIPAGLLGRQPSEFYVSFGNQFFP